jgi:hypothetical protein
MVMHAESAGSSWSLRLLIVLLSLAQMGTGKAPSENQRPLSNLPEPFAYCADSKMTTMLCLECSVLPDTSLGRALLQANIGLAVALRCADGVVQACQLGASGRACRIVTEGADQMQAMERFCREDPDGNVPDAVNYTASQWKCDGTKPVRVSDLPAAVVDSQGFIAANWQRVTSLADFAESGADSEPRVYVYEDFGACPFECCTYRAWRTNATVVLRERRKEESPPVATVPAGAEVDALTGVVATLTAGQAILQNADECRDLPAAKPGDAIEVLNYRGEGVWLSRFQGQLGECHFNPSTPPQTVWWIQIRSPDGLIGWTRTSESFAVETMDACS